MVAAPVLDRWRPTDDDLLDLKVNRRQDLIRFVLTRSGEDAGELRPFLDSPAKLSNDTSRTVPRSLDGFVLTPTDRAEVNELTDRVRVEVVLENGSVKPWGTFMWADVNAAVSTRGNVLSSSLTDEMFILDQAIGRTFGIRKGASLQSTAIKVAREVFPDKTFVVDPGTTVTRAPLVWQASDTRRKICDDCMKQAGWLPPFLDNLSRVTFKAPPDLVADDPTVIYGAGSHVIADSVSHSTDFLTSVNKWVVIANDGQGPSIVGKYEVPAQYPHSKTRRGFYITDTQTMQGLDTIKEANAAAKRLATTTERAHEVFEFSTTLDMRHDTYNSIGWGTSANFLEAGWEAELISGGVMGHKIRRIV